MRDVERQPAPAAKTPTPIEQTPQEVATAELAQTDPRPPPPPPKASSVQARAGEDARFEEAPAAAATPPAEIQPPEPDALDLQPAPPPAPPLPPADVDLATFETIWPAIVARVRDEAGPVRHALVRVAVPTAVEDGKAVLSIPAHMPFHLERLREDRTLIEQMAAIATDLLGGTIGIAFAAGDEDPLPAADVEPPRAPDKDDLEAEGEEAQDPADMVVDLLGGEIISD
jgi:hypothetical protein